MTTAHQAAGQHHSGIPPVGSSEAEHHLRNGLLAETGWEIRERAFDPSMIVTTGSNYLTGNGYLGYRGTFPEWTRTHYVGCTVHDTYDNADGTWTELCTVPNALWAVWSDGDRDLVLDGNRTDEVVDYVRELDVRTGRQTRRWVHRSDDGARLTMSDERLASMAELHLVPQRLRLHADGDRTLHLRTGIDGDVWSLNGDHFASLELAEHDDRILLATAVTQEHGIEIVVAQALRLIDDGVERRTERVQQDAGRRIWRELVLEVAAGRTVSVETTMVVVHSNDVDDPRSRAIELAERALGDGFEALASASDAAWESTWDLHDVRIEGDLAAQTQARYTLYQAIIATPRHTDHLPIGARGLSCQAYQGAAFWDQEAFNLPMFLHAEPEVARRILTYRGRTLDGARRKAQRLGYQGAFYAWISGRTGDELCPDFFFVDVLTGRPIRNHFNDWQMHVSPDVSWAVWTYVDVTGDVDFLAETGAEILLETARFVASYALLDVVGDRYRMIRLLGPDEYHENVDDNAFTNHQTKLTLQRALDAIALLDAERPEALAALRERLDLDDAEVGHWRDVRDRIFLPAPDPQTGVIEQFTGYFDLEDTTPDVLRTRLQDPGEYWGWPNGVAVHTQVIKQADVLQLHAMFPDLFDRDVMAANYDYYEPRTQHGSSLSPSAYGIVAAMLDRVDDAYRWFLESSGVDLYASESRTSGGTFIGGIRTAASAATWLLLVRGFARLRTEGPQVSLDPDLPAHWSELAFRLVHRGVALHVVVRPGSVTLRADEDAPRALPVIVWGEHGELAPGQQRAFAAG